MVRKNSSLGAQKALRERFADVFDIDIVLSYSLQEFFDFCQYLGLYGYKADGFDGKLSSPEELVRRQVGNCWDQTELQRMWFEKHGYRVRTFLLYYYIRDDFCPSHSILAFWEGKKWCWFEPMFCGEWGGVEYSGIHKYDSEEELLRDFRRVFGLNGQKIGRLPGELNDERWTLCEYTRPKYGITDREFYDWCRTGKKWVL